jgi:chemotaxis protein methyltransferase CheR
MSSSIQPALTGGKEVEELRAYIQERSGLVFDASRTRFFSAKLEHHLADREFRDAAHLLKAVKSSNTEFDALLDAVLTQETSFFRYPSVYQALQRKILPEMRSRKFWETPRSLRIWSAGCSSGEEPYSIAMTIADTLEFAESWNVHILATDISRPALKFAGEGIYSERDMDGLTPEQIESYFNPVPGTRTFQAKPKLRSMITFAPLNLAQLVYMGRFDLIFCMNVLIYFSEELRANLIQRFTEYLEPGGYLFLGHAESVAQTNSALEPIVQGDSLYYRKRSVGFARTGVRP